MKGHLSPHKSYGGKEVLVKARKQIRLLVFFSVMLAVVGCGRVLAPDQECLARHRDATAKTGKGKSIHVDGAKEKDSVHGGLGCTTCHEGVKDFPHPASMRKPTCTTCHDEPGARVPQSAH